MPVAKYILRRIRNELEKDTNGVYCKTVCTKYKHLANRARHISATYTVLKPGRAPRVQSS